VNKVLTQVNGKYICFQDADDWSHPERIAKQVTFLQANQDVGICFTGYCKIINNKPIQQRNIALTNAELKQEFLNFRKHRKVKFQPTNCPSMMITRDVLLKTKGYHPYFKGRVAEDIHWIYRILKVTNGITLHEPLYYYLVRENSFTGIQHKGEKIKYAYSWQLLELIIEYDIEKNIDLLLDSNKALLQQIELQACEMALSEKINEYNQVVSSFENSASFKLGKMLLTPFHLVKKLKNVE
ncbi:MAG: glycosyltransferase, partial [Chitinophagaceae bacterium]